MTGSPFGRVPVSLNGLCSMTRRLESMITRAWILYPACHLLVRGELCFRASGAWKTGVGKRVSGGRAINPKRSLRPLAVTNSAAQELRQEMLLGTSFAGLVRGRWIRDKTDFPIYERLKLQFRQKPSTFLTTKLWSD